MEFFYERDSLTVVYVSVFNSRRLIVKMIAFIIRDSPANMSALWARN